MKTTQKFLTTGMITSLKQKNHLIKPQENII